MNDYQVLINKTKSAAGLPNNQIFESSKSGTRYKVFISKNYVIRFRDDNLSLLLREAKFLRQLDHRLIPKVIWSGTIDKKTAMVENRLSGETIDLVWKNLPETVKKNIVREVVKFLGYLKTQTKDYIYSVNTGKKYKDFWEYLRDGLEQKKALIRKFPKAEGIMKDLRLIINQPKAEELFTISAKTSLVHGDLIIHNLLTDNKNLSGVLDWEMALFGDPDYDLCRLFYYRECARAYQEQGIDETFEADYMEKLVIEILKSNLIEDKKIFQEKYQFVRAIFYLNALHWAANSANPEKNLDELVVQWNKKSGAKQKIA